jgi:hypothetical protein
MTKIELEIFDDVISALNKIHNINDSGIELIIPEGSILFENVLNLKLIKKRSEKFSQTVHFITSDPTGLDLIDMVEEGGSRMASQEDMATVSTPMRAGTKTAISIAALTEPIAMWLKPFTNFRINNFKYALIPIVIALLLVVGFASLSNKRTATVKLTINSQPLTKSVTVKVQANSPSNAQAKILSGINLQNTLELTKETPATGEKIIGEKATGKAQIFNYTDSEKEFKKGQVLVYDSDDKSLNYVLEEDVTIAAASEELTPGPPPTKVITPGAAEVKIIASQVGSSYNIKKDEKLEVYKYDKDDYTANTSTEISGGKSETRKIVAQADLTKLSTELNTELNTQANDSLKSKVATSQTFIEGSFKVTPLKEEANHKVGDEEDTVSMTKTATVEGLVYQKTELDRLLDEMLKEFIPEGFALSTKDREINVEVLGSTTGTVLSPTEADIQVTIKSFVIPDISEEEIKKQLAGKNSDEAQKILQGVRNIETFALNVDKGLLPIFNTVPKDLSRINVEIIKK